jgi:hypothetical protein
MYTVTTNTEWRVISANSAVAFQITGAHSVSIGLSANVAPQAGFTYQPLEGDRGDVVTLFPSTAGTQLWARSVIPSEVTVS